MRPIRLPARGSPARIDDLKADIGLVGPEVLRATIEWHGFALVSGGMRHVRPS
jgi:hypothetical protein